MISSRTDLDNAVTNLVATLTADLTAANYYLEAITYRPQQPYGPPPWHCILTSLTTCDGVSGNGLTAASAIADALTTGKKIEFSRPEYRPVGTSTTAGKTKLDLAALGLIKAAPPIVRRF